MAKLNLRSRWWVFGAILFGVTFIVSSCMLLMQVNHQQEVVRRNVSVITSLTRVEYLSEQLTDSVFWPESNISALQTQLQASCSELRTDARCNDAVQAVMRYTAGADSLHRAVAAKSDAERFALWQKTDKMEGEIRLLVRNATGKVRAEQGEISASLANKWLGLHVLLITACIMMLPLFLLIIVTQRNIRRRMMTEQEARETNTLLDAILENIPDVIFVKETGDLRMVRVNKAAERLMGLSQQEMFGKSASGLFPAEVADQLDKDAREVLARGAAQDIAEEKLWTPKGERWMRTRRVPLVFDNGAPRFLLIIYEDISAQKQFIDGIKAFNEQLEHKVQERTTELNQMNRELILTEKKLLDKISELDLFFYRSSHDLKGPLASMQGLLKLALRDVKDPAALNYLGMLRQTSDKLDHILLGLLEVLRITRGEDKAEPVVIETLVHEVIAGFEHLSGRGEVKIEEEINVRRPLSCNRAALRSVIQNLLHNAIMYRKAGHASSWARITAEDKGKEIVIEISDNGVGIPDDLQEKVFDIFFRAHSSSQGSGLGLYIVKNALDKMQGTISIKSISGKGSTFTIRLPYDAPAA